MALIGNYTNQNRLGCQYFGGTIANKAEDSALKVSNRKNQYYGGVSQYASRPFGANPPYAIILAPKTGGISMRETMALDDGVLAMSQGANIEMTSSGVLTDTSLNLNLLAFLELSNGGVLSTSTIDMVGVVNMTMTDSGLLSTFSINLGVSVDCAITSTGILDNGTINMIGVATCSFTADGVLSTVSINMSNGANIVMNASGILSGNFASPFIAEMEADFSVQGFSADTLASAVWSATASANNTAGTMGEKLNDAGSASNPWTEVLTDGGYTAAELMRMFAAVLGGKSTVTFIGGVTYQVTFESIDQDAKIVVDATVVNSERTDLTLDVS